jgi:hypothetical protein
VRYYDRVRPCPRQDCGGTLYRLPADDRDRGAPLFQCLLCAREFRQERGGRLTMITTASADATAVRPHVPGDA